LREHITADKRLRYASPKLPLATSFIRKPLIAIRPLAFNLYTQIVGTFGKNGNKGNRIIYCSLLET